MEHLTRFRHGIVRIKDRGFVDKSLTESMDALLQIGAIVCCWACVTREYKSKAFHAKLAKNAKFENHGHGVFLFL
jgi:hypothetical protein